MTKDTEKDDETPIPRGGGDVSGRSATEIPNPNPKGGGDVSGRAVEPGTDDSASEDEAQSREIRPR